MDKRQNQHAPGLWIERQLTRHRVGFYLLQHGCSIARPAIIHTFNFVFSNKISTRLCLRPKPFSYIITAGIAVMKRNQLWWRSTEQRNKHHQEQGHSNLHCFISKTPVNPRAYWKIDDVFNCEVQFIFHEHPTIVMFDVDALITSCLPGNGGRWLFGRFR